MRYDGGKIFPFIKFWNQIKKERSTSIMGADRNENMASGVIYQIKQEKRVLQKALYLSLVVNLIQAVLMLLK